MSGRILGLEKTDEGFIMLGQENDFTITDANLFVDPIWLSIFEEAKNIAVYSAKKTFLYFDIKTIENNPSRGVLAHFKGLYLGGQYTEGIVPIEKNEENFVDLLIDLEKCCTNFL